jgi:hypothetical protein
VPLDIRVNAIASGPVETGAALFLLDDSKARFVTGHILQFRWWLRRSWVCAGSVCSPGSSCGSVGFVYKCLKSISIKIFHNIPYANTMLSGLSDAA